MIRSLLYVPGNTPRFLEKAAGRGADAIIVDLEDAVPEDAKTAARDGLAHWLPRLRAGGAQVFVRVNMGARLREDAVAAARAGADAIYVPKVNAVAQLTELDDLLRAEGSSMGVVPLIEDAQGLLNAQALAQGPRVIALSVGGEDLATSMGAQPTPDVLRLPKLMVHYAAKAAGRLSFGLIRSTADFTDHDAIRAAGREARAFGFDGATCIHPALVPLLNEAFAPTADELVWAARVVEQARIEQAAGRGAFTLDGRFIDAPIVTRAESLLQRFGHIE